MKRYVHEKIAFVQRARPTDEHVLVIPGARSGVVRDAQSRIYSIRSPLVSRTTQYRALLDLRALHEIIEREQPDIIECADPYQVGWAALRIAATYRIPVAAFYHSHFAEAYLRKPVERFGRASADVVMKGARAYVRSFYNRFDGTLVPSDGLCRVLQDWGVTNTRKISLGVNTDVFRPDHSLGRDDDRIGLLYVGRLAAEKNTHVLFEAFALLGMRSARFELVVVGDGQQRERLRELQQETGRVTWLAYCTDAAELAELYRNADLFVHPGVEETFGLVALEAQACGTPVVGIRGTHMDEVILHEQSDWAAVDNADDLADAIERMAARNDLRALGSAAAAEVAQRYSWSRVFADLFSFYGEVIAGYRKAS